MKYGVKGLNVAKMSNEGTVSTQPTYESTMIAMDKMSKAEDKLTMSSAAAYGDDQKAVEINEFTSGTLDLTMLDMDEDVQKAVYNLPSGTSTNGISWTDDANPPFLGAGFTTSGMTGSGDRFYEAVFYPKIKARLPDSTYETKGENVTLSNDSLSATVFSTPCKRFKVTKRFDTETAATAYLDGLFKGSSKFPGMEVSG